MNLDISLDLRMAKQLFDFLYTSFVDLNYLDMINDFARISRSFLNVIYVEHQYYG